MSFFYDDENDENESQNMFVPDEEFKKLDEDDFDDNSSSLSDRIQDGKDRYDDYKSIKDKLHQSESKKTVNESVKSSTQKQFESNAGKAAQKGADTAKKVNDAKKTAEAAKKTADAAKAAKTAANAGKFAKFMAPMMPWIVYVIIAIAIIIAVAGLLFFTLTMPGEIIGKVKDYAQGFGNALINIVVGRGDNVKPSQIAEVGDYLEQSGYDLHANGFLSDQVIKRNNDYKLKFAGDTINYDSFWDSGQRDIDTASLYTTKTGILKDKDGIVYIESDYIKAYLVSDNYVYMIKNNENTLANVWNSITSFKFFRTLIGSNFGNGLINLYKEESLGVLGENHGVFESVANGFMKLFPFAGTAVEFSIDRNAKQMIVTSYPEGFYGLQRKFLYNLDGYTGRYGMPLEFCLALHLSSMQPDLVLDLVKRTDTEIQMITHKSDVVVEGGIKVNGTIYDKAGLEQAKQDAKNAAYQEYAAVAENIYDTTTEEYQAYAETLNNIESTYNSYIADVETISHKSFSTAIPYIYRVKNHWFRDVYFSDVEEKNYVQNEDEFEARTKERWSKYETVEVDDSDTRTRADSNPDAIQGEYSSGGLGKVQYKLYYYVKDRNGKQLFNSDGTWQEKPYKLDNGKWGTKEDAATDSRLNPGEADSLHKKVMTQSTEGNYLYWEDADNQYTGMLSGRRDIWVAYKEVQDSSSGWQQFATGGDNSGANIYNADKLYYKTTFSSGLEQIEDGQRGATNTLTKEIFDLNKYYQYDGSEERAIAIDYDRNDLKPDGTSNGKDVKEQLKKYRNNETSKINTANDPRDENLIHTFSIDKNSLSAFHMLTNMGTLDADSIYRDFKELVVELNFFDKETLTEVPKDTFEWPVPESGSGGWPIRKYEKLENQFGTLMHTKVDLDFLRDRYKVLYRAGEGEPTSPVGPDDDFSRLRTGDGSGMSPRGLPGNTNFVGEVTVTDTTKFKQSDWLSTCQACWEYLVNENDRLGGGDNGITYADGGSTPMPFAESPSESKQHGDMIDCSGFVSWCLHMYFKGDREEVAQHFEGQVDTATMSTENYNQLFGWEEIAVGKGESVVDKVQPGDILVRYGDRPGGGNMQHHTAIVKEVNGSDVFCWDCGDQSRWEPKAEKLNHTLNANFFNGSNCAEGKIIRFEQTTKKEEKPYIGLDGGQYVVSPVTGMVLDAGTKLKITNIETGKKEYVGYIKIRVLDKIDYNAYLKDLVESSNSETSKKYEGYKYFLEEYIDTEVVGDVMYIEGFNLELFGDNYMTNKNIVLTDSNVVKDGEVINQYTKVDYSNVINEDARKVLQDKDGAKASAKTYVETSQGIIIKEGTAIGTVYGDGDSNEVLADERSKLTKKTVNPRTLPDDSPLLERTIVVRPGVEGTNGSDKLTEEDLRTYGNGNYIRYILRTSKDGSDQNVEKDSIIENVENYFEISKLEETKEYDWEFFYWVPYESGPVGQKGEVKFYTNGQRRAYGAGSAGFAEWDSSQNEMNCGISQWTSIAPGNGTKNIQTVCDWLAKEKQASSLETFVNISNSELKSRLNEFRSAWEGIYSSKPDDFLDWQMEYTYDIEFLKWEIAGEDCPDEGYNCSSYHWDWLLSRPMVVQGTFFSCMNYDTNPARWKECMVQSYSDEELINALMEKAKTIPNSSGDITARWNAQQKLALDILHGTFTDVEDWVRTKLPLEYNEQS